MSLGCRRSECCTARLDRREERMRTVPRRVERRLHRLDHRLLDLPGPLPLTPGETEIGELPFSQASVVVIVQSDLRSRSVWVQGETLRPSASCSRPCLCRVSSPRALTPELRGSVLLSAVRRGKEGEPGGIHVSPVVAAPLFPRAGSVERRVLQRREHNLGEPSCLRGCALSWLQGA